jgi:hypothetical protein
MDKSPQVYSSTSGPKQARRPGISKTAISIIAIVILNPGLEAGAMSDQAMQHALEVKRRHEQELLRKANVVAVGVGYRNRGGVLTKEVCIVVSVKNKVPLSELKPRDAIPAQIEDVPVDVVETGEIRAL